MVDEDVDSIFVIYDPSLPLTPLIPLPDKPEDMICV